MNNLADERDDDHTNRNVARSNGGGHTHRTRVDDTVITPQSIFDHFHLDLDWNTPFPRLPVSPILFRSAVLDNIFTFPRQVTSSDIEAMAVGLLEEIPLSAPPLRMEMSRHYKTIMAQNNAKLQEQAEGTEIQFLCKEDYALVDTEVDKSVLESRNLPSLRTLLKPLYTEIGLVPAEVRADARWKRLHPNWDEQLEHQKTIREATPRAQTPRHNPDEAGEGGGRVSFGSPLFSSDTSMKAWREDVKKSFQRSLFLDMQFRTFLKKIAFTKLGLYVKDKDAAGEAAVLGFLVVFWRMLFHPSATSASKKIIWRAFRLCAHQNSTHNLEESIEGAADVDQDIWRPLVSQFIKLYAVYNQHDAEANSVPDLCKYERFSADEVPATALPIKPFSTGEVIGVSHKTKPGVFAVEVVPVFPSHFSEAARSADPTVLAADANGLTRLLLRGVSSTVPGALSSAPHIFSLDDHALLQSTMGITERRHTTPITESTCLAYTATSTYCFAPVTQEDGVKAVSTSSVLLHLVPAEGTMARVAVFDTLPKMTVCKRSVSTSEYNTNYVVGFEPPRSRNRRLENPPEVAS